jgi:hypothetical protein
MMIEAKMRPLECSQAIVDVRRTTDDGHSPILKAHPEQAQVS